MLRRRRADKLLSLDAPAGEQRDTLAARLVSRADSPERLHERRHTRRGRADAIEQLGPDLRSVILLRYVLQYSTAETAGRLAISATAVRVRLFRARRQLRERLHEEARASVRRQVPASRRPERRGPAFAPGWAPFRFALRGWSPRPRAEGNRGQEWPPRCWPALAPCLQLREGMHSES